LSVAVRGNRVAHSVEVTTWTMSLERSAP
jgi:hypothetical protein